jgi:3-keto-disaccharide hydrolase
MARLPKLTLALLFSALAGFQYAGPASGQSSGWITLFDGKNLDQWQGEAGNNAIWRIEEGSIAVEKMDKDPKAIVNLVSKQSFTDFELRAEFWVSDDANGGIYIHCTDPTKVSSKSAYEVNIFDTRPDPSFGTGAIVNVAKAATVLKTGGKWNTYEIVAKGSKFTVTLNDVKTVDGAEDDRFPSGRIALQYGQGTVKFRKVQIKRL